MLVGVRSADSRVGEGTGAGGITGGAGVDKIFSGRGHNAIFGDGGADLLFVSVVDQTDNDPLDILTIV